jgi:hypothetical protein
MYFLGWDELGVMARMGMWRILQEGYIEGDKKVLEDLG